MAKGIRKRSLVWGYSLSVALAAFVPTLVLFFSASAIIYRHITRETVASSQALGSAVNLKARGFLLDAEAHLKLYTELLDRGAGPDTLLTAMEATAGIHPEILRSFVLRSDGYVRYAFPPERGARGTDLSGILGTTIGGDNHSNGLMYSRAFLSPVDGTVSVSMAERTRDGSVVLAELSLEQLSLFLAPLLLDQDDRIGILDEAGRFIAHTDASFVREQRYESRFAGGGTGAARFRMDGELWYASCMTIAATPWRVVYYRNVGTELGVLRQLLLTLLCMALCLVAGILGIVARLRMLAKTQFDSFLGRISAVAEGRYDGDQDSRILEFATLAEGVRAMANSIRAREEDLREAVQQRDALLREVHHRVKNNLQIVMSLLGMELDGLEDPSQAQLFKVAVDRIAVIALVHETLYLQDSLGAVHLDSYLAQLIATSVGRGGGTDPCVRTELEDVVVPADAVIPCGLILHELLMNALVHGCTDRHDATIAVSLSQAGGTITLSVSDDGPGLPESFKPERAGGLGLILVTSLADQLDGRLSWGTGPGGRGLSVTLSFGPR